MASAEEYGDFDDFSTVKTDILLAGYTVLLDTKKFPPILLLAFDLEMLDASM